MRTTPERQAAIADENRILAEKKLAEASSLDAVRQFTGLVAFWKHVAAEYRGG